jgi:hypothetical protein
VICCDKIFLLMEKIGVVFLSCDIIYTRDVDIHMVDWLDLDLWF